MMRERRDRHPHSLFKSGSHRTNDFIVPGQSPNIPGETHFVPNCDPEPHDQREPAAGISFNSSVTFEDSVTLAATPCASYWARTGGSKHENCSTFSQAKTLYEPGATA